MEEPGAIAQAAWKKVLLMTAGQMDSFPSFGWASTQTKAERVESQELQEQVSAELEVSTVCVASLFLAGHPVPAPGVVSQPTLRVPARWLSARVRFALVERGHDESNTLAQQLAAARRFRGHASPTGDV